MIILGIIIFGSCTWAVFSKHFCDGIIAKHFLIFAAITAMLVIMDPANSRAAISSVILFISGIGYWFFKHREQIRSYLNIISF